MIKVTISMSTNRLMMTFIWLHWSFVVTFIHELNPSYYHGIMFDAFNTLLCSKLCWHKRPGPIMILLLHMSCQQYAQVLMISTYNLLPWNFIILSFTPMKVTMILLRLSSKDYKIYKLQDYIILYEIEYKTAIYMHCRVYNFYIPSDPY